MKGTISAFIVSMLAYMLAGKAGLLLSIPPGFASAVWPATGVALALALRFALIPSVVGTAVGSFVINLAIASGDFSDITATGVTVAGLIGVAALLQTVFGYWLFRRLIGDFSTLLSPQQIIKFALVVALAGYTVSCTLSVLTLYLSGSIALSLVPFTWLTWWIGDSLGVLFFTPFLLTLIVPTSMMERSRKLQVIVPTLLMFLFTCALFSASLERQARENSLRINGKAYDLAEKIIEQLQHAERTLTAYSALINSIPHYSQEQFNRFSEVMLAEDSALYGVGWTEIIPHQRRHVVEQAFRDAGHPGFEFTQLSADGELERAHDQAFYYPVLYIYPLDRNRPAFGLNLAANAARKAALLKAKQIRRPVATAPIILAQETQQQKATILYKPVYASDNGDFLGYFSGVLRIEGILGESLQRLSKSGFSVVLTDITDRSSPSPLINQQTPRLEGFAPLRVNTTFGERDYQIELFANQYYTLPNKDWTSWMVLTGGFLLAALVQMFILAITGSHAHIRRQVEIQTHDLKVQTELANAASKAKSEFLSNMSHELRTPLNAIIGLINLCLKTPLSEKQSDYLTKASLASSTLLSLINQTLDHAKIEAGRLEIVEEPFSLSQTLNKLLAVFEFPAKEKQIELVADIGEQIPDQVIGDELRLDQILINLMSNALKFTEQGTVTLAVYCDSNGFFCFEVRDTGEGIPQTYRDTLFTAFEQGDNSTSRRFGGTGLGLTISRKFAQLMGGDLVLVSSGPEGSCFRVAVPLKVLEKDTCVPQSLHQLQATIVADTEETPATFASSLILLVEDTELNQLVAEELLAELGAKVIVANNGAQALEQLQQHPDIDLVLMDIQMPVMDGFEATRRIREMPAYQQLPIIAMTANALDQDVERCLNGGMDGHIAKPIDLATLAGTLARYL